MAKMEKLNQEAKAKGYKVVGMTASSAEEIAVAKNQFKLTFDFYFCDAITVKTIERANPSIILIEKGTILQKVHHNDIEDLKF
jgi:peroxiredoxin